MDSPVRQETCPDCGAVVTPDPGCTPWCDCGWNVVPDPPPGPRGRLAEIYRRMGAKFGERLFEDVLARGAQRPRPTATRLVLVAVSAAVVSVSLVVAVGAVALPWGWPRSPFAWAGGIVLALLAWLLRPRRYGLDPKYVTTRRSHPALHSLVHQIARALETDEPEIVAVVPDLNAWAGRVGFRRRKAVAFGAPLLATIDGEEIVALAGHEIAHFANGDEMRSVIVGTAIETLQVWCDVVAPDEWDAQRGTAQTIASGLMWILSFVPRSLLTLYVHLAWMDSQRAEYFADVLGAETSGPGAFVGMLERLLAERSRMEHACHRVVVAREATSVTAELRRLMAEIPPRERERIRRRAAAEPTALDATHPPTGRRVRVLRALRERPPRVVLGDRSHAQILEEIGPDVERADREWRVWYESSLYSGREDPPPGTIRPA